MFAAAAKCSHTMLSQQALFLADSQQITARALRFLAACKYDARCYSPATRMPSFSPNPSFVPGAKSEPETRFYSSRHYLNLKTSRAPTMRCFSTASDISNSSSIIASYPGVDFEGNDVAHAMDMLAKADAVCFDVDSTVVDEEGIDVLAETLGKGPEVAAWTAKAMDGNIKFEDALAARLAIIKPSKSDIQSCLESHPLRLSPGVDRLVAALQNRGTDVFLVSGGFRLMIEPVADTLGLSFQNIYANTILFDEEGNYTGFDSNEPTSADQGKPKALTKIKADFGYETMVMVGDGATDAQAKPPADAFIGFGGVVVREAVKEKACWFVRDFETMIDIVSKFGKR